VCMGSGYEMRTFSVKVGDEPDDIKQPTPSAEETTTPLLYGRPKSFFSGNSQVSLLKRLWSPPEPLPRTLSFPGQGLQPLAEARGYVFPQNAIRNQKYSILSFLPKILYEQFKFFFNLYFLGVALTQFYPRLRIGYLAQFYGPLGFVLSVTIIREAWDDILRWKRDRQINSQHYETIVSEGDSVKIKTVPSWSIKVGDVLVLHAGQRIPADVVLLRTSDPKGSIFIKTDQLDGETDWKLRRSVASFQALQNDLQVLHLSGTLSAEAPKKNIYDFVGNFSFPNGATESLGLENTIWGNTVIATGSAVGVVIYTGKETRSALNANRPPSKMGLSDLELNVLGKLLFVMSFSLAATMILLKGTSGPWYLYFLRFVLMFSSFVPISLRVNLDLAKICHSVRIMNDRKAPGIIVRCSTIPEELGRLNYLFSDKTGTLTQNVMVFKKLVVQPGAIFDTENPSMIRSHLCDAYTMNLSFESRTPRNGSDVVLGKLRHAMMALAVCHNVTPVIDSEIGERVYQAASPDEVALVKFCEEMGLVLQSRDESKITLSNPLGVIEELEILEVFPFTSESKRMGIIVRSDSDIWFYVKGAESVMKVMIERNDWLDEEVEVMAREGLRTLVFARKKLSDEEYKDFSYRYSQAKTSMADRASQMAAVVGSLEYGLQLLGLSGVEDKLQDGVRHCLETLRHAGIRIWMLTGDKDETAQCIARSSKLVDRKQEIFSVSGRSRGECLARLDQFGPKRFQSALIIDGSSLEIVLDNDAETFVEIACDAPSVIVCRCSPTQKARVVALVKGHTGKRCAAIGDGGNDVSMIQAAHVGIGIVGKEGKQASLAADFSVDGFSLIQRLILWHGRNAYKRTARMSHFIMHRGAIIAIIQAVFSSLFFFAAVPIYTGILIVGYSTFYTSLPVFSLILDEDVSDSLVNTYPELYKELQLGRPLALKAFFVWTLQSVYQGGIIMILSILFFVKEFIHIVIITFTALILSELLNVFLEIFSVVLLSSRWLSRFANGIP